MLTKSFIRGSHRVKVKYGADMMDRWGSGNFQVSQGSAGQTFCNTIYIQDSYRQNDNSQLILLAHELQHSRQCENLGGMSNFGYRYFKEYKKAGQSYANNALEREAENVADRVWQYVASRPQLNLMWSQAGPISGMQCVRVYEDADPHAWSDNFLCSNQNLGLKWSQAGPISGMQCVRVYEDADPHAWRDNYLCSNRNLGFQWSQAGPISGMQCVRVYEDADPHAWSDNYLCY